MAAEESQLVEYVCSSVQVEPLSQVCKNPGKWIFLAMRLRYAHSGREIDVDEGEATGIVLEGSLGPWTCDQCPKSAGGRPRADWDRPWAFEICHKIGAALACSEESWVDSQRWCPEGGGSGRELRD